MKILFILFIILITFAPKNFSQPMFNKSSDLIQTELDFAAYAEDHGVRDSFLKFIDDEGILFRPHPVNGKEFLSKQQKRPGLLLWYPSFSVVSDDGDLGFNTGPWEYKRTAQDESIAFGNFVTVWKKQKDGSWKFLMDIGNSNEKPDHEIIGLNPDEFDMLETKTDFNYSEEQNDNLFKTEKEFSELSALKNSAAAYKEYTSDKSIYIRDNHLPLKGNSISEFLDSQKETQSWETLGGLVSTSGDLGYTYGKITNWEDADMTNPGEELYYMRCWYNANGKWKILIDVANVIPEEKSN